MSVPLHTVVETPALLRDADMVGADAETRSAIVDFAARNPDAGEEVRGSGGVRKFRFAGRGKGKSGGFRIISIYLGNEFPVYLLAMLSKGERANFNATEIAAFKKVSEKLKRIWRQRGKE